MAPKASKKTKESVDLKEDIRREIKKEEKEINDSEVKKEIKRDIVKEENVLIQHKVNVFNPYINTTLVCPVMLFPNQLDNKKYLHLKTNLSDKLVGKCYKSYGYITEIFKIDETSDGIIEAEDPTCSAKYIVKFSCRLCYPIEGKEIIFKIDKLNKNIIGGVNGPILAVITTDKINKEKFYPDNNRNLRIKGSSAMVLPEMYIKVQILKSTFSDSDTSIFVLGYLVDIANKEEIEFFQKQNLVK